MEECYDKDGNIIGILIRNRCRGYNGDIEYLAGISVEPTPRILNLRILSHRETPGLGAKVASEKFLEQFKLKTAQEVALKKDSPQGKIDTITGATVTSRAITKSVKALLEEEAILDYVKRLAKGQKKKR